MLQFVHLPAFAGYLLSRIDDYTTEVVRLFYETNMPLLQALHHLSEEEKFQFSKRLNSEFLTNLHQNNAAGHIEAVTTRWLSNSFENVGRLDVDAKDVTIINYVRSKAQKKFINQYTADPDLAYHLHSEIDELSFAFNSQSINDYLQVLKDKIRAEEQFSDNVIEASPGIVFIYDLTQGKESYINGRVKELTGYTPREILTETNMLLKHTLPDEAPAIAQFFEQLQQDKEGLVLNVDYRLRGKSGDYRWMRCYAVVSKRNEAGEPLIVLGTMYDVSREKEMAIELQRSIEQLQEFAAIASHDLKEPLRKIGLFANIIMTTDWDKLPEGTRINLQKISEEALRMQKLIEGVLSYSAINAQVQKQTVSLEALLQEAISNLEYTITETGAVIQSDGLPEASVVPLQVLQLFQNLLSNSLKFSRKLVPPRIQVTHAVVSADRSQTEKLSTADKYLQLQFTDNGIGFNPEAAEKIFGLFQRLHNRSDFEGSGLGLAICKRIVENHGGSITAASEQGKGAVFTVLLPATEG
jgi:PAS domain S-box-containing protein